ncbi:vacuolar protein sorting-associated protein 62 [Neofusicoccum parvum]|uniref:Vacuolar protein sorting-associated protein 62 n=1 Tax=Neofusicoccum parvum TaxID=310453 RepID=A0ACB5S3Z5_9PEZI|nr:vacuolar protein sorting-associated protein 62 [Neofusicoccum parvum]GME64308.1 vacuolar protein sorting-associated protein 62 [Neofusicoccum parvum]
MQLLDPGPAHLVSLPDELVLDILQYLELDGLFQLAQTCQWGYRLSIPLLWRDVELKDCWTLHPRASRPQFRRERAADAFADEHDDTPIIKKLMVLAT